MLTPASTEPALRRRAWLAGQKSFTANRAVRIGELGELHITGPGAPFRAVQNAVSSGFFDVLGAGPMIKEHPLAVSS